MGLAPKNLTTPKPAEQNLEKFKNTSFDKIQIVADNIDAIIQLSGAIPGDLESYYGPLDSVPLTRPNGDPSKEGDTYLDTNSGFMMVLGNGTWGLLESVSVIPGVELNTSRFIVSDPTERVITIPEGLTYTLGVNNLQVMVNGAYQDIDYDYSETTTNKITFLRELESGDVVTFRIGIPIQNIPVNVTVDGDIIKYDVVTDFFEKNGVTPLDKVVYLAGYETLSDGQAGFYLYDADGLQSTADGKLLIDPNVDQGNQGSGTGYGLWVKQVFLPEQTPGGSYVGKIPPMNALPWSRWTNCTTMKTYVLWKNSNCTLHWVQDHPTYLSDKGDDGADGVDGIDGKSAYELALDSGFEGTEQEWLDSLQGYSGTDGKSAYEVAVDGGFVGDEAAWLASLNGTDGIDGKTAYEIAVENGYTGDEASWVESLKGEDGQDVEVELLIAAAPSFYVDANNHNEFIQATNSDGGPVVITVGPSLRDIDGVNTVVVGSMIFISSATDSEVWLQGDAGQGVTIDSPGTLRVYGRNSSVALLSLSETKWLLIGDMYPGDIIVTPEPGFDKPLVTDPTWTPENFTAPDAYNWPVTLEFRPDGTAFPNHGDGTPFVWLTDGTPVDNEFEVRITFISETGSNGVNTLRVPAASADWQPLVFNSSIDDDWSLYNGSALIDYAELYGYVENSADPSITVLVEIREIANTANYVAGELYTAQGIVPG